jgi:hypothetical protein
MPLPGVWGELPRIFFPEWGGTAQQDERAKRAIAEEGAEKAQGQAQRQDEAQ